MCVASQTMYAYVLLPQVESSRQKLEQQPPRCEAARQIGIRPPSPSLSPSPPHLPILNQLPAAASAAVDKEQLRKEPHVCQLRRRELPAGQAAAAVAGRSAKKGFAYKQMSRGHRFRVRLQVIVTNYVNIVPWCENSHSCSSSSERKA